MEIKALTSLRGIAAWYVVIYHFREAIAEYCSHEFLTFLGMGYLAVDLFFVLSGFVLFIGYGEQFVRLRWSGVLDFYGRRLARVYPLHLAILVMYLTNPLAIALFSQQAVLGDRYSWIYFGQSLLLIQNWGLSDFLAWNVPAWSISVELFAYLFFPLVVPVVFASGRIHIGLPLVLLGMFLVSVAGLYQASGISSIGSSIPDLGLFRCVFQFGAGLVLGWYYSHSRRLMGMFGMFSCGLGLILLVLVLLFGFKDYSLVPLVCVFLISQLSVDTGIVSRLLSFPVFHYLGKISYSTYLIHYLVRDWVKFLSDGIGLWDFLAYVLVILLMSHVLYHFVEVPGRGIFYRCWVRWFGEGRKNA